MPPMDSAKFWQMIRLIDREALQQGDDRGSVEPLRQALAACEPEAICRFADQLAQALYDLDGLEYSDSSGANALSAEGFLYARCYVVALGRDHYEAVRSDPTLMPQSLEQWCEPLLYAACDAWEDAVGANEPWTYQAPVNYQTGSNRAQWE